MRESSVPPGFFWCIPPSPGQGGLAGMPRPLAAELAVLPELGVGMVVSLLEGSAMNYTPPEGVRLLRLPIDDRHPPADVHLPLVARLCATIHAFRLGPGPRNGVVVHCLGGQGRTGLVLSCYRAYVAVRRAGDPDGRDPACAAAEIREHLRRVYGYGMLGPNPSQLRWINQFHARLVREPRIRWEEEARAEVTWQRVAAGMYAGALATWTCPECGALAGSPVAGVAGPVWCPGCGLTTGYEEDEECAV